MNGFASPKDFSESHKTAFKSSLVQTSSYITSTTQLKNVNASRARRRLLSDAITVSFTLELILEHYNFSSTGNTSSASGFAGSLVTSVSGHINSALNSTSTSFLSTFLSFAKAQNVSVGNVTVDVAASKQLVSALSETITLQTVIITSLPTSGPTSRPTLVRSSAPTMAPASIIPSASLTASPSVVIVSGATASPTPLQAKQDSLLLQIVSNSTSFFGILGVSALVFVCLCCIKRTANRRKNATLPIIDNASEAANKLNDETSPITENSSENRSVELAIEPEEVASNSALASQLEQAPIPSSVEEVSETQIAQEVDLMQSPLEGLNEELSAGQQDRLTRFGNAEQGNIHWELARITSEHEKASSNLENELLARKDSQKSKLQERLQTRRASSAHESETEVHPRRSSLAAKVEEVREAEDQDGSNPEANLP